MRDGPTDRPMDKKMCKDANQKRTGEKEKMINKVNESTHLSDKGKASSNKMSAAEQSLLCCLQRG